MGTIGLDIEENLILGIDFGTTNSVVSFYNKNTELVEIIPLEGSNIFPTAIQFENDDSYENRLTSIFGVQAKEGAIIYPECTVLSIKSMLGVENKISVIIDDVEHFFSPEQISGQILDHIRRKSNDYIQEELNIAGEFTGCVITCPANSTDKQKKKTKDAAVLAGFLEESIYIRLEPAAAAIGYAVSATEDKKVLVYDFGGGTFDACILEVKMNNEMPIPIISVLSTDGDNNLGGNDIDKIILDMIYEEFKKFTMGKIDLFDSNEEEGVSKRQKKIAIVRMTQLATQVKEKLSKTKSAKIILSPLIQEPIIVNINMEITRDEFLQHKRINKLGDSQQIYDKFVGLSVLDIVQMTIDSLMSCLHGANLKPNDIDEIFMVGGSSTIPIVSELIENQMGRTPYRSKLNPALSISEGASIYGLMIVSPKNSKIATIEKTIHSVGLEIFGRRYMEVIPKGLVIPEEGLTKEAEGYLMTNHDGITSMIIVVYESTDVSSNNARYVTDKGMKRLAGTSLTGIPDNKKGEEKVKVVFNINQNNFLTVRAESINGTGILTELTVDSLY